MYGNYLNGIVGLIVGDSLGVPVEFSYREDLKKNPVTSMREYGTHNQPKGTWSDDSSMTLATYDSLKNGYNLQDIMARFMDWFNNNAYTPYDDLFDIGNTTSDALYEYKDNGNLLTCGKNDEYSNGNGSLMRILPLCIYCYENNISDKESIDMIHATSALTHAHIRSMMSCGIYYFCVKSIIANKNFSLYECLYIGLNNAKMFYRNLVTKDEFNLFDKIFNLSKLKDSVENNISSSSYVIDTLHAVLWCLCNTNNYKNCVLKAVNLGRDTDTVAAIAGGLAGLYYGYDNIPNEWVLCVAKIDWIKNL